MNDKSKDTAKVRQDLKRSGIRSGLWLGQNKNGKCSKPYVVYSFTPENRKKFCQFIKGVKLPDVFRSNFKHKVTDNDTNIMGLKSHDCHIKMQRLFPYGLQQYLPNKVAKPIIELCSFFKQICSATLMEDDMLKAQTKPEGSIAEGYVAEEALTFSSHYFWDVTMKFNHLNCNVDPPPPTCQFQVLLSIRQRHIDKDPGVSASSELFALACRPTPTPISVNSCVVNGVRFVMYSRDERHTTKNSGICSPGGKDGEMYYGQLQEILEFSYLLFKVVLFRVKQRRT
ncbi:reverse transcriptase domain-containing protein [Tanacetum coccineum]|uniref:Reverse transcriptase domain-containing protein n=1 Tax=Tanacetum coccineum TaxID=301880 RepID=A0ABQ5CFF4_9ASTR